MVTFEILLRGSAPDSLPTLETLEQHTPSHTNRAHVAHWLRSQGVTVYDADFSLSCTAPQDLFERLFRAQLEPLPERQQDLSGNQKFQLNQAPRIPRPIIDQTEEIVLSRDPELF